MSVFLLELLILIQFLAAFFIARIISIRLKFDIKQIKTNQIKNI